MVRYCYTVAENDGVQSIGSTFKYRELTMTKNMGPIAKKKTSRESRRLRFHTAYTRSAENTMKIFRKLCHVKRHIRQFGMYVPAEDM